MAFDLKHLSVLHYVDAYGFTMWHYACQDDLRDIGANYFDGARDQFHTGDIVYLVHASDGKAAAAMAVVAVTDQGVDHSIMAVSALPRRIGTMTEDGRAALPPVVNYGYQTHRVELGNMPIAEGWKVSPDGFPIKDAE